jgi:hypothetical protein
MLYKSSQNEKHDRLYIWQKKIDWQNAACLTQERVRIPCIDVTRNLTGSEEWYSGSEHQKCSLLGIIKGTELCTFVSSAATCGSDPKTSFLTLFLFLLLCKLCTCIAFGLTHFFITVLVWRSYLNPMQYKFLWHCVGIEETLEFCVVWQIFRALLVFLRHLNFM